MSSLYSKIETVCHGFVPTTPALYHHPRHSTHLKVKSPWEDPGSAGAVDISPTSPSLPSSQSVGHSIRTLEPRLVLLNQVCELFLRNKLSLFFWMFPKSLMNQFEMFQKTIGIYIYVKFIGHFTVLGSAECYSVTDDDEYFLRMVSKIIHILYFMLRSRELNLVKVIRSFMEMPYFYCLNTRLKNLSLGLPQATFSPFKAFISIIHCTPRKFHLHDEWSSGVQERRIVSPTRSPQVLFSAGALKSQGNEGGS